MHVRSESEGAVPPFDDSVSPLSQNGWRRWCETSEAYPSAAGTNVVPSSVLRSSRPAPVSQTGCECRDLSSAQGISVPDSPAICLLRCSNAPPRQTYDCSGAFYPAFSPAMVSYCSSCLVVLAPDPEVRSLTGICR